MRRRMKTNRIGAPSIARHGALWRFGVTPVSGRVFVVLLLAACGLLTGSFSTHAVSARKLIQQGNAAYQSGRLEQALSAYDEASVDAPESPEIYYNRGAVYYRQEDYEQARAAFEKAALKSVEPVLESRARYNLGNCAFREAERQRDSDLQKSLESCEAAIKHYQDALRRNRYLTKAAENIEIVRLYMKALLDEIEKQKQEQQQQQQQQEDLAEKLKKLIERQAKALADNRSLLTKANQPSAAQQQQEIALGLEDLTREQASIQTDSEAVSKAVLDAINQHAQQAQAQAMPPMPGATNQPPVAAHAPQQPGDQMLEKYGAVKEHVDNAIGQQKEANQKLPLRQLPQAQPHQQASEEELKKAREALQEKDQQQQQQQQQQQGDENEDSEEKKDEQQQQDQQQQEQEQGEQEQKQGEEEEEQKEQEAQAAKAEDILNQEKDQREQRRRQMPVRFRAVDKNW